MKALRLIGMFLLGLFTILAASGNAPAYAGGPEHEVRTVDVTFVRPDLSTTCGFTVTEHVAGTIEDIVFIDDQGNVTRILEHYQFVTTFAANGQMLTASANGPVRIVFNADGSTTVYLLGTGEFTTAPGNGVVHGSAGQVIITIPVSGPQTVETHGLQITSESGFCSALAP